MQKMLIYCQSAYKYVIIINIMHEVLCMKSLASDSKPFKVAPKAKFPTGLGEKNGYAIPN